jgi:hypothetical protein
VGETPTLRILETDPPSMPGQTSTLQIELNPNPLFGFQPLLEEYKSVFFVGFKPFKATIDRKVITFDIDNEKCYHIT